MLVKSQDGGFSMTWIKDELQPIHNLGYKMGNLTREALEGIVENMKANPPKRSWVIYPPIEWVWATEFKEKTIMEKIEIKMARFIELSKKFTVTEDMIDDIADIKDLMEPEFDYSRATLTVTDGTLWGGHGVPTPEDIEAAKPKKKSEKERLEEGVTRRWEVYEEYKEYLELQKTLGDYFQAKEKV